jgi:hypothetical protein
MFDDVSGITRASLSAIEVAGDSKPTVLGVGRVGGDKKPPCLSG